MKAGVDRFADLKHTQTIGYVFHSAFRIGRYTNKTTSFSCQKSPSHGGHQ